MFAARACFSLALLLGAAAHAQPPMRAPVPVYGYEVVASWPHDPGAFTQGLLYDGGVLYESTGLNGRSGVREVELQTGRVRRRVDLPFEYFGEGLAALGDRLFQLTWRNGTAFVYARDGLKPLGQFRYDGEGWGLTSDGRDLIMSDGTHRLRVLDPKTFAVRRTIAVHDEHGRPVANLNELEYIKGEIFANVWYTDRIARIDPATGELRGWVDLTGLNPARTPEAVLNGIAYDSERDRIFVTGKLWPRLYEIRLKK